MPSVESQKERKSKLPIRECVVSDDMLPGFLRGRGIKDTSFFCDQRKTNLCFCGCDRGLGTWKMEPDVGEWSTRVVETMCCSARSQVWIKKNS